MNYEIVSLNDRPDLKEEMAEWFSSKWGHPKSAYLESMEECLVKQKPFPQWYIALEESRIVGGLGVIENDFHNRKDLSPNVCAVYTEEDKRGEGIAGALLNYVCKDMKNRGIDTLYLITNHTSFYERYGWEFLCMAEEDSGDMTKVYIHRA